MLLPLRPPRQPPDVNMPASGAILGGMMPQPAPDMNGPENQWLDQYRQMLAQAIMAKPNPAGGSSSGGMIGGEVMRQTFPGYGGQPGPLAGDAWRQSVVNTLMTNPNQAVRYGA